MSNKLDNAALTILPLQRNGRVHDVSTAALVDQVGTGVVGGRTQQVLDVTGSGQHERTGLPILPQSA